MAARIAITPQELHNAASQFNQKADELRDIIAFMRQQVGTLDGSWEGAAKIQYFSNFEEMAKIFDQIPEGTDGIASTLTAIAESIVEMDEVMASKL